MGTKPPISCSLATRWGQSLQEVVHSQLASRKLLRSMLTPYVMHLFQDALASIILEDCHWSAQGASLETFYVKFRSQPAQSSLPQYKMGELSPAGIWIKTKKGLVKAATHPGLAIGSSTTRERNKSKLLRFKNRKLPNPDSPHERETSQIHSYFKIWKLWYSRI